MRIIYNIKKQFLKVLMSILAIMLFGLTMTPRVVEADSIFPTNFYEVFPDTNLASAISSLLNKNPDDTVTLSELTTNFRLFNLDISDLDIVSLEGIQHINVRQLTARNNNITDLSFLTNIPNLVQIILDGNPLSSVSSLGALPNLQRISLINTLLNDIDFSNTYASLQRIDVSGTKIHSISSSPNLPGLREIYLRNTAFENLQNLTSFSSSLRIIDVSYTMVKDFSLLANFPNIANFIASGNPDADFNTLPYISTMAMLVFNDNLLTDLSFLSSYPAIPTLFLNDNSIRSSTGISDIQIGFLHLDGNNITDTAWLSSLTKVLNLNLNRNHISDLTFLDNLPNLRSAAILEQIITEDPINLNKDSYELVPSMTLLDVFNPVTYESDAIYNEETNTLVWSNIQPGSELSYQWNTFYTQYTGVIRLFYYSGKFVQPIEEVGYQVTYMYDQNTVHIAESVNDESFLTLPPVPIKDNHRFSGWYQDADFENIWNFNTDRISSHMTLYALFVPIPTYHTVSFDTLGGTTIASQNIEKGHVLNQPDNPSRSGFNFQGWYTTEAFDYLWNFETDLVDESMTLYAKWQVQTILAENEVLPDMGIDNTLFLRTSVLMVVAGIVLLLLNTKKKSRYSSDK